VVAMLLLGLPLQLLRCPEWGL